MAAAAVAVLLIGLAGWFMFATPIGAGYGNGIRPPHGPHSIARIRD